MDCGPPGSSVHGISQTRILEWVAIPSSMGSSQPRDGTHRPVSPALQVLHLLLSHQGSPHTIHRCCSSVVQSCPTLCDPTDCSTPGFLSIINSPSLLKLMSIDLMMPTNHLILCCPLLLLPTIFPSIRVSSNESTLRIRWPKYWSFSFIISPCSEYLGLISFRIDWFAQMYNDAYPSV